MDFYTTADVPEGTRADYWADVFSKTVAPITLRSGDDGRFNAMLEVGAIGQVEFARVRSDAATIERSAVASRGQAERRMSFIMIIEGHGAAEHCGRESRIKRGDVLLTDGTEPLTCRFDTAVEGLTVRAGEAAIESRLPGYADLRGRVLPAESCLTDTAVGMARSLCGKLDMEMPSGCAAQAASHLLDVLATASAAAFGAPVAEGAMSTVRRERVRGFIEDNLRDPELSPGAVASKLRISPRYLRKVMAVQGETASSYILRRRLEECARELSADASRARSITDVAYSWGFNSTAHFARAFKARYGVPPRDFRFGRV